MSMVERNSPASNSAARSAHSPAPSSGSVTAWPTVSRRSASASQSRASMRSTRVTPVQRARASEREHRQDLALAALEQRDDRPLDDLLEVRRLAVRRQRRLVGVLLVEDD